MHRKSTRILLVALAVALFGSIVKSDQFSRHHVDQVVVNVPETTEGRVAEDDMICPYDGPCYPLHFVPSTGRWSEVNCFLMSFEERPSLAFSFPCKPAPNGYDSRIPL